MCLISSGHSSTKPLRLGGMSVSVRGIPKAQATSILGKGKGKGSAEGGRFSFLCPPRMQETELSEGVGEKLC